MEHNAHDAAGEMRPRTVALVARHPSRTLAILALALAGWLFLAWLTVVWFMWSIMMAAMMRPSALPMILSFVHLAARSADVARASSFAAAYLAVRFGFSAGAGAAQWVFQLMGWVNPMVVSTSSLLTGVLLLIAGVYQFSPLKRICLSRRRTALGLLLGEWCAGTYGAFVMGLRYGLFCLGCCWALMALLFVGGVMKLPWIAALSITVAVEKLLPRGEGLAAGLGSALIGMGCIKLLALSSAG
jgi:predicted metal-binding membrane protein